MTTQTSAKPGKLKIQHMMAAFGVGHMTIYNWRLPKEGSRKTALPCVESAKGARNLVTFHEKEVKAWAKANGVELVKTFAEVTASKETSANVKPGPKTGNPPPAAKKSKAGTNKPALAVSKKAAPTKKPTKPPAKAGVSPRVSADCRDAAN